MDTDQSSNLQSSIIARLLKAVKKERETLLAAVDPHWNWRGLRAAENPVLEVDNPLPDVVRNFMRNLDAIAGGTTIVYGGALNDLVNGKTPKDFDSYILTRLHPLVAMHKIKRWAKCEGYQIVPYRRRVRLLWKRLIIRTDHGDYDLACMQGKMPPQDLLRQMADEADISPCARSATADQAFVSQRCLDGEANNQLIFRSFSRDRDRYRHLDRFHKYAIVKYQDRAVVYQDPADTALFSELNAKRREIADHHVALTQAGYTPTNFEPFRPLVQGLHDRLLEKARPQLT